MDIRIYRTADGDYQDLRIPLFRDDKHRTSYLRHQVLVAIMQHINPYAYYGDMVFDWISTVRVKVKKHPWSRPKMATRYRVDIPLSIYIPDADNSPRLSQRRRNGRA